jgi:single-stranded-DNA-specific exonuclease
MGKASARTAQNIYLYDAIKKCSCLLESYGGHAQAAGLSIEKKNMKRFSAMFDEAVAEQLRLKGTKPREIHIDYELNFEDITETLLDELQKLEPYGVTTTSLFS